MTEVATRVRVATAFVLLATFVIGGAAGFAVRNFWHPHHHRDMPGLPLNEVGLTPEQDKTAREIIERRRPELDAIFKESFPKVRAIHEDIEREVRKILTPEQQKKLDEAERRHPHRPPGGPGGFFGAPPPGAPEGPRPPPGGPAPN